MHSADVDPPGFHNQVRFPEPFGTWGSTCIFSLAGRAQYPPCRRACTARSRGLFQVRTWCTLMFYTGCICGLRGDCARLTAFPLILRPCGILNAYASSSRQVRERLIERLFQRRLLHQAALMHYTTEQEAADAGPYVGSSGHVVIPLGVTLTSCRALPSRAEFDEQYPKARARKVVLYFGRLHRKKRIDLVIRAVGDVVREGHDLHLIIAGPDGGVEAQCRRMVQDERLENRTTFTGLLVGHAKRLVFWRSRHLRLAVHDREFRDRRGRSCSKRYSAADLEPGKHRSGVRPRRCGGHREPGPHRCDQWPTPPRVPTSPCDSDGCPGENDRRTAFPVGFGGKRPRVHVLVDRHGVWA